MTLALAVVLAAVHALWSLFQWTQLVRARSGGDYFCGVGVVLAGADPGHPAFAALPSPEPRVGLP